MQEAIASPLSAWESFYVIVGSSAAALTGLQFVVIALVADSEVRGGNREIAAFGSPTVVHFCLALLVAAVLSAPWRSLASVAIALALVGAGGLAYAAVVIRRAFRTTAYTPVLEDWIWHTILPPLSYATILGAGALVPRAPESALFAIGAATVLLVFIGIHNAWDTVTYIALRGFRSPQQGADDDAPSPPATGETPAPAAATAPER